jgi:hypothetical protein
MMVEAMEVTDVQIQEIHEEEYTEKIKVVYPHAEEDLIDFLNRCKLDNKGVMLSLRCSAVCDKGQGKIGTMRKEKVFCPDQTICKNLVERTLSYPLVRFQLRGGCIRD